LISNNIYITPKQYGIVKLLVERLEIDVEELTRALGIKREDLMRDLAELERKELIRIERYKTVEYVLSETGKKYIEKGLPEEQVYGVVEKCIGLLLEEFLKCVENQGVLSEDARIGLQYLIKSRCVSIENDKLFVKDVSKCLETISKAREIRELILNLVNGGSVKEEVIVLAKRRRIIETRERSVLKVRALNKLLDAWRNGLIREKELVTVIRPEIAKEPDKYIIKEFDLTVELPDLPVPKKHPFMQFIDELREIMLSMGFEEVKGPHVEAELWNFDVLFQAQDHPAREIHDTFFLKTTLTAQITPNLLDSVKRVHEAGWGYVWNPARALKLVLRSQTTAVTARALYERGGGEYRVFTIDRNFRPENLDAKHSMEFYQLDGVIVGKNVNFKHLLFFFKELAAALGLKEVWFKPGYFPFTEPSVEGYVKHPKLGWIEVFPGGMFRPEVMEMLRCSGYNAAAWGIGVDRLAMIILGIDDIRLLFTNNVTELSNMKYRGLEYTWKKTTGRNIRVVETPY
jgi:phenylalanyl-tRNA synthetase alpha chain